MHLLLHFVVGGVIAYTGTLMPEYGMRLEPGRYLQMVGVLVILVGLGEIPKQFRRGKQ